MQININFIPRDQNLYFVGGTVRDLMLNRCPRDYDLVTTGDAPAAAEKIAALTGGRIVQLGKSGMYLYRVPLERFTCDVTEARGQSITTDLKARDFSINAMAVSTMDGELLDPVDGRRDLECKTIRMISLENLLDDPVRFLRAYRLAAELGFFISDDTRAAIRTYGHRIKSSAGERIRDELIKFFAAPGSSAYIRDLSDTRMANVIFPGFRKLKGCGQNTYHIHDVFDHTIKTYTGLEGLLQSPASAEPPWRQAAGLFPPPENRPLLKCAALLHDIGKPGAKTVDDEGRIHFYHHEKIGADMAAGIFRQLKFSNPQARYMEAIIRQHLRPLFLFMQYQNGILEEKNIYRFFLKTEPYSIDLLLLATADAQGKASGSDAECFRKFLGTLINTYIGHFLPARTGPQLISGHDVMTAFSLPPSPLIGKVLAHIREQQFLSNIRNRKEALELAKIFLSRRYGS
jgi:poly(A) polymerase